MPPLSSMKVSDKEMAEELAKLLSVILKVLRNEDKPEPRAWNK